MPLFISRDGSNRLRRAWGAGGGGGDEGEAGRLGTAGSGSGRGGGGGGVRGDPKASMVSFLTVSNNDSNESSSSLIKVQRTESFKRRFGLTSILTRGKNRTTTGTGGQSDVSSQASELRRRAAVGGELETGSKDGHPPAQQQQQQPSAAPTSTSTSTSTSTTATTTAAPARIPPSKLSNPRHSRSPPSPIAPAQPAVAPPAVSAVLSAPAELSSHSQPRDDENMASTATMTSVMQQQKRRSFSLTLTVDELPHHHHNLPQASPPAPPSSSSSFHPTHASRFNSSYSPSSPSANEKQGAMSNTPISPYSSLLSSPVISQATTASFSRPMLVDSPTAKQTEAVNSMELRDTIRTPVGYYITPSQTPTLDLLDLEPNIPSVPTVVRPGPSTPPLTEHSTALTLITTPRPQSKQENDQLPDDRSFQNGPPTPASSNSSQKEKDLNRRVNFAEDFPGNVITLRGNPNPPKQARFGPNRPPPGRPLSANPRSNGPNQPPIRGPPGPRGKLLLRAPPRPPSPIYMQPPDMRNHKWAPLKASQLECIVGHTLVPFKNKQHSIVCEVCRSMEFEGRGEQVKKSFYCSWCAVRICGECKEMLVGDCRGNLAELWDRTERKRGGNMLRIRGGMGRPDSGDGTREGESFGERWNEQQNKMPQGQEGTLDFPFPRTSQRGQRQSMVPPQQGAPQFRPPPQQRQIGPPQPEQSRPPQQQPGAPQLQQPRPPQQRQLGPPQPEQSRPPQQRQLGPPQSEQSRTLRPLDRTSTAPPPRQSSLGPPPPNRHSAAPPPRQSSLGPRPRSENPTPPRQSNLAPPPPPKEIKPTAPTESSMLNTSTLDLFRLPPPPPVPKLTQAETEKYRLMAMESNQKSTVVMVGEKGRDQSIGGSVKKKRGWLRGFGKK